MSQSVITNNDDQMPFRWDILFGHIEVETRERDEGLKTFHEFRAWNVSRDGTRKLSSDWECTTIMHWPNYGIKNKIISMMNVARP